MAKGLAEDMAGTSRLRGGFGLPEMLPCVRLWGTGRAGRGTGRQKWNERAGMGGAGGGGEVVCCEIKGLE